MERWRERPMMSPFGGFLIQTRNDPGNFEVVIAWPAGGLAHYWRDNRDPAFQWNGPTLFGNGEYIGATVIESDFRAFSDRSLGNLEVLATRSDGTVDHYWRENGGQFVWNGPFKVFDGAGGNPSMAYTGLDNMGSNYYGSSFYVVAPHRSSGFAYWQRRNGPRMEWLNLGGTGSVKLVGMALAITTMGVYSPKAGYKYTGPGGLQIVAGVSDRGLLHLYVNGVDGSSVGLRGWTDQTVFGRELFHELDGEFAGTPCLIQGDYGYDEVSDWVPFDSGHLGNLELVVPGKNGGILHFWRDCGEPMSTPKPIHEGWGGPVRIPGGQYDEVSLIQSSFSTTDHGNLEMVARKRHQQGFDFFWRDENLIWHGPQTIGVPVSDPPPRRGDRTGQGGIAAASRIPNSLELWWIGANGSVQDAYWYEGAPWQRFELAPADSASLQGGIAAATRIPSSMELWWVGANGSVQDAYWYEGGSWKRFELAPAGSASLHGGIAAVSRIPSSMELWWVGANGSVQDAYWYEGASWQRFELAPAGSASLEGGIAAVSRIPGSMEVWWVGANGSVQDAYWYEGAPWQRFELAPADSASLQGGIAAVSRIPGSMELWWIGPNGSVQDAYWYEGASWQRFELAPAGSASARGGIAAVSRIPNSMEIWWIGDDGSVQGAYWYEGAPWQRYELAPAGSASVYGGISAVSRIPNSMEIWWIGGDGSVQGAYWYEGGKWELYELAPAGSASPHVPA